MGIYQILILLWLTLIFFSAVIFQKDAAALNNLDILPFLFLLKKYLSLQLGTGNDLKRTDLTNTMSLILFFVASISHPSFFGPQSPLSVSIFPTQALIQAKRFPRLRSLPHG